MKNKHPKLELARKMMTPKEIADKVSPFSSEEWLRRKDQIAFEVKEKELRDKDLTKEQVRKGKV